MSLYVSYTESQGQDEAKELVLEAIEEQYQYFSPDTLNKASAKDVLTDKIKELSSKIEECGDFDSQVYYAEKVDALQLALEVLDYDIT